MITIPMSDGFRFYPIFSLKIVAFFSEMLCKVTRQFIAHFFIQTRSKNVGATAVTDALPNTQREGQVQVIAVTFYEVNQ